MTNDLQVRLWQHKNEALTSKRSFAGRYNCYYLVYWEWFQYVSHAMERERQIKGWTRKKKIELIEEFNPEWRFLNNDSGFH